MQAAKIQLVVYTNSLFLKYFEFMGLLQKNS